MVIKVRKYADGGKVMTSDGSDKPKPPPKPKTSDTVQSPKPESAADALRNQRARQMKELGLKDGGPVPNPKAKLGSGGRFAAVEAAAKKSGARNPAAVAAAAGIKKYGKKKMASMAAAGRKRRS